jgi:hypothetical protein
MDGYAQSKGVAPENTNSNLNAANSSSIATLKQMFPGINMTFGGQPRGVST